MDKPCRHLKEYRSTNKNPYTSFHLYLQFNRGRPSLHRDPSEHPRCATCHSPTRLFACLSCASLACISHAPLHSTRLTHVPLNCPRAADMGSGEVDEFSGEGHAPEYGACGAHAQVKDSHARLCVVKKDGNDGFVNENDGGTEILYDHVIFVDVDRAELFCSSCLDQVYDRDFDNAVVKAQMGKVEKVESYEKLRKRRRVDYRSWAPDLRERTLINKNATPLVASGFPWGFRGLNNLGNTCFMNSVLQALLHTPPLRNYFLSDRHNRFYCQQQQQKNGVKKNEAAGDKDKRVCLACDLDAMFSAMFSDDRKPYSPAKFLYSWWQHAANLACYEQQDAHEFFISMLDGIHEKAEKDKRKPQSQGSGECCIAHRVFSGILRSDVMCTVCGFTSTTFDPCVDISLDLETNQGPSTKSSSAKSHNSCNGKKKAKNSSQNCGISTLVGCLDRFTKPEKLGSEQKLFCQQCQVRQESLKQMSIKKLPLVSCFHIKRFEHSHIRKMSRKIDRYLQFPFSLDMGPYMSSSILRSRFGNRIFSFEGDDLDSPSELSSEFELFAVITHSGKLDSGHYVTYLRLSNQWYKCDDAWITHVNESIVRAAQGYMIFYVQKMLYYKAIEKQAAL